MNPQIQSEKDLDMVNNADIAVRGFSFLYSLAACGTWNASCQQRCRIYLRSDVEAPAPLSPWSSGRDDAGSQGGASAPIC